MSDVMAPNPFAPWHGTYNNNPIGIGFWTLVREDFATHGEDIFSQGFWALFWHRFGNWRMSVAPKLLRAPLSLLYRMMAKLCEWICGMSISYTVKVGHRVCLEHFGGMVLVAHSIGDDVTIRQNTTFGIATARALEDRPIIENGVDIGAGAVIAGRVRIEAGAIVGANTVVVRDVAPGTTVGGVPARVLKA